MGNVSERIDKRLQEIHELLHQLIQHLHRPDVPPFLPLLERIYTKEEAAELLNITEATLSGYVNARKIPFCKPTGGKVYFLHTDLINWLKLHRRETMLEQLAAYEASRPTRRRATKRKER